LNPGTELCHAVDLDRLYTEIRIESLSGPRLISAA
jgi:hypothetical protein